MIPSPPQGIPSDLVSAEDYERHAERLLPPASYAYIAGGSGNECTVRRNRDALNALQIQHRLLVDCRQGSTALTLFGQHLRHPLLLAPVAFQTLVHPDGELATRHAADVMEACMIGSTLSSFSLEDIAAPYPNPHWFQLYFQPQRAHTLDLLRRAETAGYRVLVVTLDAAIQSASLRARRCGFVMPATVQAANLVRYPAPPSVALARDQSMIFQGMMSEAPTWQDLEWLIGQTRLPVIVKGVMHPADAARLITLGVQGLVVSNHGGRALDQVPGSIEVLPALRAAVGPDYPLLFDGGIRSGHDAFKALASGANGVLIGRLQVYALAVAGALGVAHLLKLLREELELCMALAGCPRLQDITTAALYSPACLQPAISNPDGTMTGDR